MHPGELAEVGRGSLVWPEQENLWEQDCGGSSWLEDIRGREAVFKEGEGFGHRASSLLGVKILGGR